MYSNGFLFFKQRLFWSPVDILLLRALIGGDSEDASLAEIFAAINVESEAMERLSLLSRLCLQNGYRGVPACEIPRFKGLSRYFIHRNAKLVAPLLEFAGACEQCGIELLLCKDIALRLGDMKAQARHMRDADVAIRPERYEEAVNVALSLGYSALYSRQAVQLTRNKNEVIVLHRAFHKTSACGVSEDPVWRRSLPVSTHDHKFFLPCLEDMLVQLLANEFSSLIIEGQQYPRLKWAYDCGWLITQGGVDREKLFAIARECRMAGQVKIMLLLLLDLIQPQPGAPGSEQDSAQNSTPNSELIRRALPGAGDEDQLCRYYQRSITWINRYSTARKSRKMRRYIKYWLPHAWHRHCYHLYGMGFWQRLGLFPATCKELFGIKSWLQFPAAAARKISACRARDLEGK